MKKINFSAPVILSAVFAITVVILIANVASLKVAVLVLALLGLACVYMADRKSRQAWEHEMTQNLSQVRHEYDRLVRETARTRTELLAFKKSLADTGAVARSYARLPGEDAEQRMLRAIVEQFTSLKETRLEPLSLPGEDWAGNLQVDKLTDGQLRMLVHHAVDQDRLDLFLQPIVTLPQRKTRFFEMLSRIRIREGEYLPAEKYIGAALAENLLPAIDNLLLLSCLRHLRDLSEDDAARGFFCNITGLTLADPKFMADLVEFIAQHRELAPRLVFELSQKDIAGLDPDKVAILRGLSQLGCRFSMDGVASLAFDIDYLENRYIRFIKIGAEILLRDLNEGGLQRIKRLKADLDRAGIDLIIEKVESEKQIAGLHSIGIDFGQGFLFGKPELAAI